MQPDYAAIRQWLEPTVGTTFEAVPVGRVAGGSINHCVQWRGKTKSVFLKIASADRLAMFEAEAAGLQELGGAALLRVPAVIGATAIADCAVLALEWLELTPATGEGDAAHARLGERLATQHRITATAFGWSRDNTIGVTAQPNAWHDDWVGFFVRCRLGHQLDLAEQEKTSARIVERGRKLCEACGALFSTYRAVPSLLHGDLWGGNWAVHEPTGEPVLFDPAVYYGDREADLAMTHLFGGFGPGFYAAYRSQWPLDPAADTRRTLYNLYHVLNHHHLFGGGYGAQAGSMIDALLAELR
jgi:protein-ribulosamine 3-kinase